MIHLQVDSGTCSRASFSCSRAGLIVLKAELKSTNRILALVPDVSYCLRVKWKAMFTASSTDLLAL